MIAGEDKGRTWSRTMTHHLVWVWMKANTLPRGRADRARNRLEFSMENEFVL